MANTLKYEINDLQSTCAEHLFGLYSAWTGQQEDEMDEFFLQLSELARAGWSLQIHPEPDAPTLPATRAVILWSYEGNPADLLPYEPRLFPFIDWINLFAPETEMRKAVAKMHAWVFRIPPFGKIPA